MAGPERVPVLIIGAGIVGLSTSLFLSEHDIRHLVVERHTGTSIHPRARGFNGRTMEMFREVGVDEDVREVGAELGRSYGIYRSRSVIDLIGNKKRSQASTEQNNMPGGGIVGRISPTTGARGTQDLVEPVLLKAAQASPHADLRFNTECTRFEQTADCVMATIRDRASGHTWTVQADYMLGADGANSPVRKRLGISTTGTKVLGRFINVLFEADLREFVRGREFSICVIDQPDLKGNFASINNSDRWVFHISYNPATGATAEDYTFDRCAELVKKGLGMPDVKVKIISALPWESVVRVAETFQKGRIFLAGDSAHQMPPWRGQGANSGIADAHNLAWKLSAVLKGNATPALLETYNSERHPVDLFAAEESGRAADKYGNISTTWLAFSRILRLGGMVLGYGYRYESKAIIPDTTSPYLRLPWHFVAWLLDVNGRPGTRAPHLWLQQNDRTVSTLDVCKNKFTLLTGAKGGVWQQAASKIASALHVNVNVFCIGPQGNLVDTTGQWESAAGISSDGALLVRPDSFVAWRSYTAPENIEESLNKVVKQVLCRA